MTEQEKEKAYNEYQEDKKNGFPRYRERVSSMSFKERVSEFFNLSDADTYEKTKIIYETFTLRQQDIFEEKYIDADHTLRKVFGKLIEHWKRIVKYKEYAEADLQTFTVFETNVNWLNDLIHHVEGHLQDAPQMEEVLQQVKSYKSPLNDISIKVGIDESTGQYVLNCPILDKDIKGSLSEIYISLQAVKSTFVCVRSFLDSLGIKRLFPEYLKMFERSFKNFDTNIKDFSTKEANIIRKIPKIRREPEQKNLLIRIESNETKGYAFPDYNDITPDEDTIKNNLCLKIWKEEKKR